MGLGMSPRAWYAAVSWHVRGLFASEGLRRIGFSARDLWQPAEVEARRGLARDLATEVPSDLVVDPATGHRVLSSTAMPNVDEVCRIGHAIVSESGRDDGESAGQKKFSRFRIAKSDQRRALLAVALDRRLLAMVSSYFGVVPVITEADFYASFAIEGPYAKSQLWHCDDDASAVLKLFVYCDGVTPSDGPFELVRPDESRYVRTSIGYRYAGRRYRVSDEVMQRYVPDERVVSLVGPRGTTFAVDTARCFHRGSRIRDNTRRRIAAMICYAPPNGHMLPRRLVTGKAPLAEFASSFPGKLEQAVLGMPIATKWL
jgi:hypothetical protein